MGLMGRPRAAAGELLRTRPRSAGRPEPESDGIGTVHGPACPLRFAATSADQSTVTKGTIHITHPERLFRSHPRLFGHPPLCTLISHSGCPNNERPVTQSSRRTQSVSTEAAVRASRRDHADAGTHSGNASTCSTQAPGGVPAFPEARIPPTMAQVVSTSPPTCAVVQNASW